jgi:hypothetical protein
MAKSTKNAPLICGIMTLAVLAGAIGGVLLMKSDPVRWQKLAAVLVIAAVLPAVIYEVYRTEGFTTKLASAAMLVLLTAVAVIVILGLKLDLGALLGGKIKALAGVNAALLGPGVTAVISLYLIRRTAGVYTKWLAAIILGASVALLFVLEPAAFGKLLGIGLREGAKRIK